MHPQCGVLPFALPEAYVRAVRTVFLAIVVTLATATSSFAQSSDQPHSEQQALKILKTDLGDALKLERDALQLSNAGEDADARSELENARGLIVAAEPAAEWMSAPPVLALRGRDDPWESFEDDIYDIDNLDKLASHEKGSRLRSALEAANLKKLAAYALVSNELAHPDCAEIINRQGPLVVDNVPQGPTTVTVDFACKQRIDEFFIALPTISAMQALASPPAQSATIEDGGELIKVDVDGAKSGGVTFETTPDAAAGDKVDGEVVPIAGDSVTEYIPEVM
jgi:hypothetical protein